MSVFELSVDSASSYLQSRGYSGPFCVRALGGGVSNTVLLVQSGRQRFVLKQALPQLRVAQEWLADRSRILRERDALLAAAALLPRSWIPAVVWSDDEKYLYAMEALPDSAESWKERLLRGELGTWTARRAGIALSRTIAGSWRDPQFEARFGDQTAFGQLRTDPYYRTIGRRHPAIAETVEEWIAEIQPLRLALTHGDWSPKNMVLAGDRVVFIDYECAHFGDPAYDAAFCVNHLVLKAYHLSHRTEELLHLARVFFGWTLAALPPEALNGFERRTARHLAFLMLARIDGKSPAEYLTEETRARVRQTALTLIKRRTDRLEACFGSASEAAAR